MEERLDKREKGEREKKKKRGQVRIDPKEEKEKGDIN